MRMLSVFCFMVHASFGAQTTVKPIITFFIQPYKAEMLELAPPAKITVKPNKITKTYLKHHLENQYIAGIYVTFAGYIATSDTNGQVTLPRKQTTDELLVIVTPIIDPVILRANTINNFMLNAKAPYVAYKFTRLQDAQKRYYYWQVQQQELPPQSRIPDLAVVIFAKPTDIVIPTGNFVTEGSINLLLPTIYSKKKIHMGSEALRLLKTNRYFAPVKLAYKFRPDRYATMVVYK